MKFSALFLSIALLLAGCAGTPAAPADAPASSSEPAAVSDVPEASSDAASPVPDASSGETLFPKANEIVWSYPILEGTELENEIVVLEGPEEGPTVFVVGGQHGAETAGWSAGNRLKEQVKLTRGKLYILSPANIWGAKVRNRYITPDGGDLNRAYPGDPNGEPVERLGNAIWNEVLKIQPDFILDLHEGSVMADGSTSKWSAVGNSIIYNELVGELGDILFDFMLANEAGEVCSTTFTLLTPSAEGGLVYVASSELGIPSVTVETYSGVDSNINTRIADHLDIVNFVLSYYDMIDPAETEE